MRGWGDQPAHLVTYTTRLIRAVCAGEGRLSESLRLAVFSPTGSVRANKVKNSQLYPLPLSSEVVDSLSAMFHSTVFATLRKKKQWDLCTEAWCGLMILALNEAAGHKTTIGGVPSFAQKKVLEFLSVDAFHFVLRGIKVSPEVEHVLHVGFEKVPEIPWSSKLPDMSISYTGEVVDKARWLTTEQVIPGLPPKGLGGSLEAVDFCNSWVRAHLEQPHLSRLNDSEVGELPHAVVRATQGHWDEIAQELVSRGIACVIPESEIATCRGELILNGAFGVVKPNKWVNDKPILRLIMDSRAANAVHRSLPGAVESMVGPSKWQGICLGETDGLAISGDDLVSCFYLFAIPYEWSRYFAFRKKVRRGLVDSHGDPNEEVYIASKVIPMGWSAAVTVVQHLHRRMALQPGGLPSDREIHRERPLPEKGVKTSSGFWNLYIDDLTVLEVLNDAVAEMKEGESIFEGRAPFQVKMQEIYEGLGVPYSKEKGESRVQCSEKLGAQLDGARGTLGASRKRCLELVSLGQYLQQLDRVPTKWIQIFLGKFVHIMQFRRPLFSMVEHLWKRVVRFSGGPLTGKEVMEIDVLLCLLPLCYCNLRAGISGQVTASDASESGGGLVRSVGLAGPGMRNLIPKATGLKGIPLQDGDRKEIVVIEWFAGIGGLTRSLERLGIVASGTAVCDQDEHCLRVLREFIPGATQWRDICLVDRKMVDEFLSRYPNAEGCIQGGAAHAKGFLS